MIVTKGSLSFQATTALAPYLRVKLSSGKLVVADGDETELGVLEQALAADALVPVVPRNAEGTVRMVAGEAITQYATVYGYDGGKVGVTSSGGEVTIGIALEAASGDGSYVEVLRTS